MSFQYERDTEWHPTVTFPVAETEILQGHTESGVRMA